MRVREVVQLVENAVKIDPVGEYKMAGVKWYGEGVFHRETVTGESMSASWVSPLVEGALIYNRLFAWKKSFAVVPPAFTDCFVSTEFPQFIADSGRVLQEYLYLLCTTDAMARVIDALSTGSAAVSRNRFQEAEFLDLEIPLPPLAEQRTIVSEWQQAQAEVAAVNDRVKMMEADVVKTFYGDLDIAPPVAVQRPKCFALNSAELSRWSVFGNVDAVLGLDRLPPARFTYAHLGDHAAVSYGIQKSPANRPGQHPRPYLSVANVRKGYLDLSDVKQINVPDSELATFRLDAGDILFVEGNGSRSELGRVAMWNGEIADCVHQNHLLKVRVAADTLLPEFAMTWFNTDLGRSYFFRSAKTSTGLGTINSNEVRRAPIPFPPLEIQRSIVARVTEGRVAIARERETARRLAEAAKLEIETRLLGQPDATT